MIITICRVWLRARAGLAKQYSVKTLPKRCAALVIKTLQKRCSALVVVVPGATQNGDDCWYGRSVVLIHCRNSETRQRNKTTYGIFVGSRITRDAASRSSTSPNSKRVSQGRGNTNRAQYLYRSITAIKQVARESMPVLVLHVHQCDDKTWF